MDKIFVLASIATTALCWGVYGPVLHWGQQGMGHGRLRPFMAVGIAYFLIAIVVPLLLIFLLKQETAEKYQWTASGTFWSLAGGAAGAIGALGIIMAFRFGGTPAFVMPLVFGCAPIVNTAFVMFFTGAWRNLGNITGGLYFAGLILVAVGAVMVLMFAPKASPSPGGHGAKPAAVAKDLPRKA
jgi:hypothetical protein